MLEQGDLFSHGDGRGSGGGDGDEALSLARYAERAYLDYAISVVKGRALPDVRDGQKPVQRRILHAMNEMGLGAAAKPVKAARVVGEVLGRFHPHGDVAAYDALVRMAQDFTLRYPLIDGQGNFGSRDGDGAAAMRYTEARLTRYAELLLSEIDEGTVDFAPNYDGSTEEPRVLPARLPMLLLNGASGIAVGMATEIPPHNLREVAEACVLLLKEPDADIDQVLAILPGPDFPGGGQVISTPEDLREIYAGGRGSIKVRARYRYEDLARGQWQLVVNELPHGVSAQRVLEEIEEITNPKAKAGKKSPSPEQLQARQTLLAVLDSVRDESGKDAAVRLVFEPRTSRIDQAELLNTLLAHTSLESSVPANLVMIGTDGRPRQKALPTILGEWCAFRIATVSRRSRYRLGRIDDRIHLLEGRQLILLRIDEVIRIIRESDEPRSALIAAFGLSERQADDILEIRLRQLARLETLRIEKELTGLRADKRGLETLLGSAAAMRRQVIREIEADAKQFGDDRRTLIEAAARASVEQRIVDDPVTVIVSTKGWVRSRQGHGHDPAQLTFKAGDGFDGAWQVRTTDQLFVLATNGRVFSVPVAQLPSARGDGVPISSLIELETGTRVAAAFAADVQADVLFALRGGNGLRCLAGDLVGRTRQGKAFLTVEDGDAPLRPSVFGQDAMALFCYSEKGRALVFPLIDVKSLHNGGRGTILMGLDAKETLMHAVPFGRDGLVARGTGRGAKRVERRLGDAVIESYVGARGRKGRLFEPRLKDPLFERCRPENGEGSDGAR